MLGLYAWGRLSRTEHRERCDEATPGSSQEEGMTRFAVLELVIFLVLIITLAYGVKRSRGVLRALAVIALGWVCITFLVLLLIDF
jgi:hypothetical protein